MLAEGEEIPKIEKYIISKRIDNNFTFTFTPASYYYIYAGARHDQQQHQNGHSPRPQLPLIICSSRTWQDQLRGAVVSFNAIGQPPIFNERITNHRSSCSNRLFITKLVFYSARSKTTPDQHILYILKHRSLSFDSRVASLGHFPKRIDSGLETPHAHRSGLLSLCERTW